MRSKYLFIICLLVMGLAVGTASATNETYSGVFGTEEGEYRSMSYTPADGALVTYAIGNISVYNIQGYVDVKWLVATMAGERDAGSADSAETTVTIKTSSSGSTVGTGNLGYNYQLATDKYVVYLEFLTWDVTGLSGTTNLFLEYDLAALHNFRPKPINSLTLSASQPMVFSHYRSGFTEHNTGPYTFVYAHEFSAPWSIFRENGIYEITVTRSGGHGASNVSILSGTTVLGGDSAFNITDFHFTGGTIPVRISVYDSAFNHYETDSYFQPSFSLDVVQSEITLGGTAEAQLRSNTGSFSLLNAYTLIVSEPGGGRCYVNNTDPSWILSGSTWKQWDIANSAYAISYGATFPSTVTISGCTAPGEYTAEATVFQTDGYSPPKMTDIFTVLGSGQYQTVTLNVKDAVTQGYIPGAIAAVKLASGTWVNRTVTSGPVTVQVPTGSYIAYTATATGYNEASVLYTQINHDATIDIGLTKTMTGLGTDKVWLNVYVRTASGSSWVALSGAQVVVSGDTKTTPESGIIGFSVATNATHAVTASKAGYTTQTRSVTLGTAATSVSLELQPLTVSTTVAGVTTVQTLDVRTSAQKQQAMMDILVNNGEMLVTLCVLCMIVYLVGGMGKK